MCIHMHIVSKPKENIHDISTRFVHNNCLNLYDNEQSAVIYDEMKKEGI